MTPSRDGIATSTPIELCRHYAGRAYACVDERVARKREFHDDDDFAFISLIFLHKLLVHAKSVSLLCSEGLVSDAGIVARTMLEGFIYLAWINENSTIRAKKYRNFAIIEDFRTIREAEKLGKAIPPDILLHVQEKLKLLDDSYLNKHAKREGLTEDADPYQKSWNYDSYGKRVEIAAMASEIGDDLLKDLYDQLSKWSHWSIRGVGSNLRRDPTSVRLASGHEGDAVRSLIVVVITLTGAGLIVEQHLGGGSIDELYAIRQEFTAKIKHLVAA